jgi:hypothetical protein
MGTIHDRLKQKQSRLHTIKVDDRARQVTKSPDLLRVLSVFLEDLDRARTYPDSGSQAHHLYMQTLADQAKALGLKGHWNLLCNRTQCLRSPAHWYNRGSYAYYCADCARELNQANANDSFCRDAPLCHFVATFEESQGGLS